MNYISEKNFDDDFFVALVGEKDGKVLGIQHTSKRIYVLDMKNNKKSVYMDIPFEKRDAFKLFQTGISFDHKKIFLPFNSNNIIILENEKLRGINIKKFSNCCTNGKFMNAIRYKNHLIFIPYAGDEILWFDVDNERVFKVVSIKKHKRENDRFYSAVVVDETVYIPSMETDNIIEYNILTDEVQSISTGIDEGGFAYVTEESNKLYMLLSCKPRIVEYDLCTKSVNSVCEFPSDIKWYGRTVFDPKSIFLIGNRLFCFPGTANMAVIIDIKKRCSRKIDQIEPYCCFDKLDKGRFVFDGGIRCGESLYFQYQNDTIVEMNIDSFETVEHKLASQGKCEGFEFFIKNI